MQTQSNNLRTATPSDDFENFLSQFTDDDGILSAAHIAQLDRQSAFPDDACQQLNAFGLHHYYVPTEWGGCLQNYQELLQLWRLVARHDLTLAIAHGKTFLGSVCIWLSATNTQAKQLAEAVMQGKVVSWGLTERGHGSDLLAGELSADKTDRGWCINGEKWLINNASRGQLICLLARTNVNAGPRGFSLFLLDKQQLSPQHYRCLPKERTYGIRGADISGIAFDNAEIENQALIGNVGGGAEAVLKALQLTRTSCVALSLGAADQALGLTLNYVRQREIYDRHLLDLPNVQTTLGKSIAELFLAEAVSVIASRSIHALPTEMSVISSISKAFVPSVVDDLIARLAELLGVRAYLMGEYAHGLFQKLERDHRIVAIFDGSTVVNRNALINQFSSLINTYRAQSYNQTHLSQVLNLQTPLPAFKSEKLRLTSTTGCSLVQSLPAAVEQIQQADDLSDSIKAMAGHLRSLTDKLVSDINKQTPTPREVPTEVFDLAQRYEWCFAGSACLQLWLYNAAQAKQQASIKPLWEEAAWLKACLALVLDYLQGPSDTMNNAQIYQQLLLEYNNTAQDSAISFLPHCNRVV